MLKLKNYFLPKDFIETAEGLLFAVVQAGTEKSDGKEKVLCFLRYIKNGEGTHKRWQKIDTTSANDYLKSHYPDYLYHSPILDTNLHAVEIDRICNHKQPKQRLQRLLQQSSFDKVERDCFELCALYSAEGVDLAKVGVTGSLLIGTQQSGSDIDIVVYDRQLFHEIRQATAKLITQAKLSALSMEDWREAYSRRMCALTFNEYLWHERRKLNKAVINGRKFDLNFVSSDAGNNIKKYHKLGSLSVSCTVTNADHAFDYPAEYQIDHPVITKAVSFTATYNGQALAGEKIEVSGLLEQAEDGAQRIVVGSSREAPGEYIKVISCLE